MKKYLVGNSVKKVLSSDNSVTPEEYVCVIDRKAHLKMQEAFDVMCNELTYNGIILNEQSMVRPLYVKDSSGNRYTLAHCTIRKGDKISYIPSNMIRYCSTKLFSFQSVFIDESNDVIDITSHGVRDLQNNFLDFNNPREQKNFRTNPEMVIEFFHTVMENDVDFEWSDNLYRQIRNIDILSPLCPINLDRVSCNFKDISISKFSNTFRNIDNVIEYIKRCGVKIEISVSECDKEHPKETLLKPEMKKHYNNIEEEIIQPIKLPSYADYITLNDYKFTVSKVSTRLKEREIEIAAAKRRTL